MHVTLNTNMLVSNFHESLSSTHCIDSLAHVLRQIVLRKVDDTHT